MNPTFSIFPFNYQDRERVDVRLQSYLDNWQLNTIYEGTPVNIPGHSNSRIDVIKYFQVIKRPGDPFYREDERDNEIGMTLWAWWPGYDHEVEINIFISGKAVLNGKIKVHAEILKCGGASMELFHNDQFITNFTKKEWFSLNPVDKVWTELNSY